MNEEQLVNRCLEMDSLAQKQLFELYSKKMMGICLRYVRNTDEAEDVLQLGFIKVFNKLHTFNKEGSLQAWIKRIIINTAIDSIRKNKKFRDNIDLDTIDYQLKNTDSNILDALSADDLLKIIQNMPLGFRTVFNMYVIEGYTHSEISENLNISLGTSKSQYSRARVYLQKKILQLQ